MKTLFFVASLALVACQKSETRNVISDPPNKTTSDLPDRITCTHAPYELHLVVRDPKLTNGMGAIGLFKNGQQLDKFPTMNFTVEDEIFGMTEIGAQQIKRIELDRQTHQLTAQGMIDPAANQTYDCKY